MKNETIHDKMESFCDKQAMSEGWLISFANRGESNDNYELQKYDDMNVFKSDADAMSFVLSKSITSDYHNNALQLLRQVNPQEYKTIIDTGR